jgi:hypothetical protein
MTQVSTMYSVGMQCRRRWKNCLNVNLKKGGWCPEVQRLCNCLCSARHYEAMLQLVTISCMLTYSHAIVLLLSCEVPLHPPVLLCCQTTAAIHDVVTLLTHAVFASCVTATVLLYSSCWTTTVVNTPYLFCMERDYNCCSPFCRSGWRVISWCMQPVQKTPHEQQLSRASTTY